MAALIGTLERGPLPRGILAQRLGMTDRRMRRAIDFARRNGHLVITLDGSYQLARSLDQFTTWAHREQESRLRTFGKQLHAMRQTAARLWPEQLVIGIFGEEATA